MIIRVSDYDLQRFFVGKDYVEFDEIIDKLFELDSEKEEYKEKYEDSIEKKEQDNDKYEDYLLDLM